MSELTIGTLSRMHAALAVLGNRKMASPGADLKVGRMLRQVGLVAEGIAAARQRIVLEAVEGLELDKLDTLAKAKITAEIHQKQRAFDLEPVSDYKIPTTLITEKDLPKEMAGDEGWKNATGLGALIADLGPLYEDKGE